MEDLAMLPILKNRNTWPGLVDEFFNGEWFPTFFDQDMHQSIPAVNIAENKDAYRIEVAAPGLNKEDFRINLENNVLTISSEKEEKKEDKEERFMRKEFSYYTFKRSFTLPSTINSENIQASHQDGVLQVIVPKREEAKEKPAREIKVG
jgi:HSP20 family protein